MYVHLSICQHYVVHCTVQKSCQANICILGWSGQIDVSGNWQHARKSHEQVCTYVCLSNTFYVDLQSIWI